MMRGSRFVLKQVCMGNSLKEIVSLIFIQWLKDNFLGYIDGWEEVMGREEFTTTPRKKMSQS